MTISTIYNYDTAVYYTSATLVTPFALHHIVTYVTNNATNQMTSITTQYYLLTFPLTTYAHFQIHHLHHSKRLQQCLHRWCIITTSWPSHCDTNHNDHHDNQQLPHRTDNDGQQHIFFIFPPFAKLKMAPAPTMPTKYQSHQNGILIASKLLFPTDICPFLLSPCTTSPMPDGPPKT
eukprot:jgi/Psemu1/32420/gm1.32420_g